MLKIQLQSLALKRINTFIKTVNILVQTPGQIAAGTLKWTQKDWKSLVLFPQSIQHTCMQATYHRISVWALGISIANFFFRCCICFCFCISFDIIPYDTRKKSIRKSYEHVTIWIVVHCVEMLSFISLNWNIHAGDSKLSNKPPTHLYSHTFFYVLFDSPPHTHKFRSNN